MPNFRRMCSDSLSLSSQSTFAIDPFIVAIQAEKTTMAVEYFIL